MIPKVYVQFSENNVPATRNLYDCWIGFVARGHEVIPYKWNESVLETDKLKDITKQDILCAGIPVYNKVLEHLGVAPPSPLDYPECFLSDSNKWFGRKIGRTTLGAVRDDLEKNKLPTTFIKPVKQKQFTGFVVSSFMDMLKVCHLDDSTEIYSSSTVRFLSEYRVYVNQQYSDINNSVVSIGLYNGNPLLFPDVGTIKEAITLYNKSGAPISYALDVGVVQTKYNKHKTLIVECNSFACLGNYSCPSMLYAKGVEAYWFQVINGS